MGVAKAVRLTSFVYFRLEATLHAGDMVFQTGVIYTLRALANVRQGVPQYGSALSARGHRSRPTQ